MRLLVKFWGARGSIPTPGPQTRRYGGNTSCVEIRTESTTIICDAGSGIRNLGQDLLRRGKSAHTLHLLLSHTHWDHIQGFPFFVPAYLPSTHFHIYDLAESPGRFHALLSGQMTTEYCPVRFADLQATITPEVITANQTQIGDILVRAYADQHHPGGSIGYSFEAHGVKVVFSTDNELDLMRDPPNPPPTPAQKQPRQNPAAPSPQASDATIHRFRPGFVDFIRNADLLIADAQYTEAEYASRIGWGHSSFRSAIDLGAQSGARQLALTHHDPARSDTQMEEVIAAATARAEQVAGGMSVFAAREGMELAVTAAPTQPVPTA